MGELTSSSQINMVYTHGVTPGQDKAFVFGMNGSGMYGTATNWPKGIYCVQIFQGGPTIDQQWPVFNRTHKGMSFEAKPPYTSCAAAGAKLHKTPTQIANPVLADGTVVRAGSWFAL